MDTRHLRSFLKIAETGSISRAAVSLGITQPSLSQHLLRVEDEVGLKLFNRNARGVALTEAGRIFQDHAKQIVRNTEQAVEDARQLKVEVTGQVIMAMPYSISKIAGTALIKELSLQAPQVGFRLVEAFTAQIRGWLDQGKIDLGILHDEGTLRHLSAKRLVNEELFLIGSAGKFGSLEHPGKIALSELSNVTMLLPGAPHGLRNLLELEATRRGFHLNVRFDIDAIVHIVQLVGEGFGYSILPLSALGEDLEAGKISIARIGDGSLRRTLCLVRNNGQLITHASLRCEDLTVKVLRELIENGKWAAKPESALQ